MSIIFKKKIRFYCNLNADRWFTVVSGWTLNRMILIMCVEILTVFHDECWWRQSSLSLCDDSVIYDRELLYLTHTHVGNPSSWAFKASLSNLQQHTHTHVLYTHTDVWFADVVLKLELTHGFIDAVITLTKQHQLLLLLSLQYCKHSQSCDRCVCIY